MDGHANEVILSYDQKFKKLDHLFAADAVGDGTSDIVGPFEAAMSQKPILEPDTNSRTRGFATQISWRWIIFLLSTTYLVKITLQNGKKIATYSTQVKNNTLYPHSQWEPRNLPTYMIH